MSVLDKVRKDSQRIAKEYFDIGDNLLMQTEFETDLAPDVTYKANILTRSEAELAILCSKLFDEKDRKKELPWAYYALIAKRAKKPKALLNRVIKENWTLQDVIRELRKENSTVKESDSLVVIYKSYIYNGASKKIACITLEVDVVNLEADPILTVSMYQRRMLFSTEGREFIRTLNETEKTLKSYLSKL